jgi:hypothetical protein
VFLSSSTVIPVSAAYDSSSPRSAFRDAFATTIRRQASLTSLANSSVTSSAASSQRLFPFSFGLPRGARPGEEMPPTFSVTNLVETAPRGRAFVETAEVAYTVSVVWEADGSSQDMAT